MATTKQKSFKEESKKSQRMAQIIDLLSKKSNRGGLTRPELAAALGTYPSNLSNACNHLIFMDVVRVAGETINENTGRKCEILQLNQEFEEEEDVFISPLYTEALDLHPAEIDEEIDEEKEKKQNFLVANCLSYFHANYPQLFEKSVEFATERYWLARRGYK